MRRSKRSAFYPPAIAATNQSRSLLHLEEIGVEEGSGWRRPTRSVGAAPSAQNSPPESTRSRGLVAKGKVPKCSYVISSTARLFPVRPSPDISDTNNVR
jgi:hypothetical protein